MSKFDLTVAVTRYAEDDTVAERCLQSLSKQRGASVLVLFLDQQTSLAMKSLCSKLSGPNVRFQYTPIAAKSLSFARNYGIKESKTDHVAFCDVDCTLEPNWAAEIARALRLPRVAIAGTKVLPAWNIRPNWYHKSKYILEFYSMLDLSKEMVEVQKIVGASFAINKKLLGKQAYFDENFGRRGGKLLGGEETDLCARAIADGHLIMYNPMSHANHWVEPERMRMTWLWRRAYFGGVSRAARGGKAQTFNSRPSGVDYMSLCLIIVPYVAGYARARFAKAVR